MNLQLDCDGYRKDLQLELVQHNSYYFQIFLKFFHVSDYT